MLYNWSYLWVCYESVLTLGTLLVRSYNVNYDPVHDMTSDAHHVHRLRLLLVCKTILFVVLLSMIFNQKWSSILCHVCRAYTYAQVFHPPCLIKNRIAEQSIFTPFRHSDKLLCTLYRYNISAYTNCRFIPLPMEIQHNDNICILGF